MEILNGRYKVLNNLQQDKLYSSFLVKDRVNLEASEQVLILPHSKIWQKSLLEEARDNFIFWTGLEQDNLMNLYRFDILDEVDGHKLELPRYFYVREYHSRQLPLDKLIPSIKAEQAWDIYEQICRAVNYILLRGEKIPYLSPSSIYTITQRGKITVKIEDILTLKIKKNAGMPLEKYLDIGIIKSLGLILLSLITNKIIGIDSWQESLGRYKEQGQQEEEVAAVIAQMANGEIEDSYRGIYASTQRLMDILERDFALIDRKRLERFNPKPRLIGRDRELETLLKYCEDISKNRKKLLLLRGEFGIGKSRLLKEVAFHLRLNGMKTFYFEPKKNEIFSPWEELAKEALTIRDLETAAVGNSVSFFNDEGAGQKDFNKMYNYLRELWQEKRFAVFIDRLEEFSGTALSFLQFLLEKGLLFFPVVTTADIRPNSSELTGLLEYWQDKNLLLNIDLNRLDWTDTAAFIKELLSLPHLPRNFARVVLEETGGNPVLIRESLKSLKADGQLFIGERGNWEVTYSDFTKLNFPKNLVEALREQYSTLSVGERRLLQIIAAFEKSAPLNLVEEMMDNEPEVRNHLNGLQEKDLIVMMIGDEGYSFDFNQQHLKRLVYRDIPQEEREELHRNVLQLLEEQFTEGQHWMIDEIAYHLKVLGQPEKAADYYHRAGNQAVNDKKLNKATVYFQKALQLTEDPEIELEINRAMGETWFRLGNNKRAVNIFKAAFDLARKMQKRRRQVQILNYLSMVYYRVNNLEEARESARKAVKLSLREWDEYWEGYYHQLRILYRQRKLEEAAEKVWELLVKIKEFDKPVYRGRFYNLLGLICMSQYKSERALEYYHTSIRLFKKAGEEEELLKPNNNIGVLYSDHFGQPQKALKYYYHNAEIAEKLSLKEELFTAYNNIASILSRPKEALKYLEKAYTIAQLYQNEEMLFICRVNLIHNYLETGEFNEAYEQLCLMEKQSEGFANSHLLPALYFAEGSFYYYTGYYERAARNFRKLVEVEKSAIPAEQLSSKGFLLLCRMKQEEGFWPEEQMEAILTELDRRNFLREYQELLALFVEEAIFTDNQKWLWKMVAKVRAGDPDDDYLKLKLVKGLLDTNFHLNDRKISELDHIALELEREGLQPLVWRCKFAQGYFGEKVGRKKETAFSYLQALDIIGELTVKVPVPLREHFLATHHRWRVRVQLNELLDIREDIQSLDTSEMFDYSPYRAYLREQTGGKGIGNLLQELAESWKGWEKKILQHGLEITDASRACIYRLDNKDGLKYGLCLEEDGELTTFDEIKGPINRFLNQGVEEYCIQDTRRYCLERRDNNLNEFGSCRGLCFTPIRNKKKVYGYLYFDCNRLLHNIQKGSLARMKALAGLLVLYYEHQYLEESSSKDKITGALTRRFLEQTLRDSLEYAGSQEEPLSLIIFDIDDFKVVNDRFGHRKGDQILGYLAQTAEEVIREKDILGRYGGEEFLVIMPNTKKDEAHLVADRLRETVANSDLLENFNLTISLGIASYPEDALLMEELIEKADQALYVAKEEGKDRSCIWKEGIASEIQREDKLAGIITGNLVQDQRRGLVIVELLQLLQEEKDKEEKIFHFLGRILESVEAESSVLYLEEGYFARKRFEPDWAKDVNFDPSLVRECWDNGRGKFILDWELSPRGTGNLYSLIISPVMANGKQKGVLLLASRAEEKEFDFKQFNYVQTLCSILGSILVN
ncbi:MAG: diguanylate cyclase [Halanaerobium sp.]|nr:diguanylate cyclase [Halanaerobium sp.]